VKYFGVVKLENGNEEILEDLRLQAKAITIGGKSPKFLPFFEECLSSMKVINHFKLKSKGR
jgi:hypothetical protein